MSYLPLRDENSVENDVSMLTPSVLIRFSSNLQVTRTGIKSPTSSNFDQIPSELGAIERLKHFHILFNGKMSPS